jgi:hypothetical protein
MPESGPFRGRSSQGSTVTSDNRKHPPRPADSYIAGAPIPQPEVQELNPSAFGDFEDLARLHEERFAQTAPGSVSGLVPEEQRRFLPTLPDVKSSDLPAARGRPGASQGVGVQSAIELARRMNRVCPLPEAWQALYEMLPLPPSAGELPPPPITGQAWNRSSDLEKRLRLREQLEWAAALGKLDEIYDFLRKLPAKSWHYMES